MRAELRRFTVDDYEAMVEAGVLGPDDRVELLDGVIVEMAAIGSRHFATVNRLTRVLIEALGDRAIVSPQNPVRLPPWSEPEPDVAVFRPAADTYASGLPESEDTLLCVEVADTTVARDREKMALYARNGVPEAWLVNIPECRIEVYREPGPDGYTTTEVVASGGSASPLAFPDLAVAVAEVIPAPPG